MGNKLFLEQVWQTLSLKALIWYLWSLLCPTISSFHRNSLPAPSWFYSKCKECKASILQIKALASIFILIFKNIFGLQMGSASFLRIYEGIEKVGKGLLGQRTGKDIWEHRGCKWGEVLERVAGSILLNFFYVPLVNVLWMENNPNSYFARSPSICLQISKCP